MSTTQPSVFVNSSAEGIARVKAGGYAFLMESTMIEYRVQRDCDLMQVGGLLDSKGYGIGLPRGSPLREDISNALLKLQEDQFLHLLKLRWWVEKSQETGAVKCDMSEVSKTSTSQLGISQVGGVFACLVIGLAVGILLSIFEFCYRIKRRKTQSGTSFFRTLFEQCRLVLHIHSDKPPPTRPKSGEIMPNTQMSRSFSMSSQQIRQIPPDSSSGFQYSRHHQTDSSQNPAYYQQQKQPLLKQQPNFDETEINMNRIYQQEPARHMGSPKTKQLQQQSSPDQSRQPSSSHGRKKKRSGLNANDSLNDIKFRANLHKRSSPSGQLHQQSSSDLDATSPYFLQY